MIIICIHTYTGFVLSYINLMPGIIYTSLEENQIVYIKIFFSYHWWLTRFAKEAQNQWKRLLVIKYKVIWFLIFGEEVTAITIRNHAIKKTQYSHNFSHGIKKLENLGLQYGWMKIEYFKTMIYFYFYYWTYNQYRLLLLLLLLFCFLFQFQSPIKLTKLHSVTFEPLLSCLFVKLVYSKWLFPISTWPFH